MFSFVFSLFLSSFLFFNNTAAIVDNLKNIELFLNYPVFEKYVDSNINNIFLQNYYSQNLQNIASIDVDSWCDRKIFQIKVRYFSKESQKIFNYYLRCFLEKQKKYISAKIVTNKVYFRLHNIKVALKHLDWKIWKLW